MTAVIEAAGQPTSTVNQEETIIINPARRKRSPSFDRYNPVIMATVSGNDMKNCRDVRDAFQHCLTTHSKDTICKTAASYFSICMSSHQE